VKGQADYPKLSTASSLLAGRNPLFYFHINTETAFRLFFRDTTAARQNRKAAKTIEELQSAQIWSSLPARGLPRLQEPLRKLIGFNILENQYQAHSAKKA
jgi:hypothetical protein